MRMARPILIAAILVLVAAPADGIQMKLGAQVSGVRNAFTGELPDEGTWKGRFGIGAGLVAEFSLADDVAIGLQPTLVERNSRQEFEVRREVIGHRDYEVRYLSLPVVVRVTGDPVGVRGFVTAGVEWGFLVDATTSAAAVSSDISDALDPTTIGALFGAGALVPLGRQFLSLELRYVQGLDDIVARNGGESESGLSSPSVKYRGLQLVIGYLLRIGGN